MNSIAIISLVCLSGIVIWIFMAKRIMRDRIAHNKPLPKPAFFIMRNVLKFRRNPEKIQEILEQAGIKEGMNILDYGCGIGSYAIEAAKLAGKSGKVVAADINEKMLQEVQKNMHTDGLLNIRPQLITAPEDVNGNKFDVIFLIDVLHLLKDPLQTIEAMFRKLTATGKLLVKFEHFSEPRINSLLAEIQCSNKGVIDGKYWLLNR